jgi:hypothetical protein
MFQIAGKNRAPPAVPEQLFLEAVGVVHEHDDPVAGPELRVVNTRPPGGLPKRTDRRQQRTRQRINLLHQQLLETFEQPVAEGDRLASRRLAGIVSSEELGSDLRIRPSQGASCWTDGHEP